MTFVDTFANRMQDLRSADMYPYFPVIETVKDGEVFCEGGQRTIMFASCDYLGLAQSARVKAAAIDAIRSFGVNTFGAQIFSGYSVIHRDLEAAIADFVGKPAACLMPSGSHANIAVLSALYGPNDTIISDRNNHISLFTGCRLSGSRLRNYYHRDTRALEKILSEEQSANKRVIVTDGLFSADGDLAPLQEIIRLASVWNAEVIVDEAHSFGTLGSGGRGAAEATGSLPDVTLVTGTMSKALGSTGGFVAGPQNYIDYIRHNAPMYTSSRGVAYPIAAASLAALTELRAHGDELRARMLTNIRHTRSLLTEAGLTISSEETPILSIHVGDTDKALALVRWLQNEGVATCAMIPPSVMPKGALVRLGVTSWLSTDDIERACELLSTAKTKFGL